MANQSLSKGKLLNIELDSPPNYVYTNGEIISGRVTLRSSADEDVYSIVLVLTGTGKSYVGLAGRSNQQMGLSDRWEGSIFLDMHQQLYQGTYKLRKNVTYEWPFKMRFPDSKLLIPSGSYGKHQMMSNGDTGIEYELKVSRATSAEQAKALLEKAVKGQDAGIKAKFRGLTASTASVDLNFLPSRPTYIPPQLTPVREVWTLPVYTAEDLQAPAGRPNKFNLKSIFKAPPTIAFTVRVDLPKNFVQYEHLPAFIRIIPKYEEGSSASNHGPITVEKVEFIVSMRVRHKASGYAGENLEQFTILKLEKPGIIINDSSSYYIGGKYSSKKSMWPTFNSSIVETRHILRAHITLDASGKKFKDIFPLTDCHVYHNRVTPSPLNMDYACSFSSQSSPTSGTSKIASHEHVPYKDALEAFFVVSRLLAEKNILPTVIDPRDPTTVLSLLLPGQAQMQAKPHAPMPESSVLPGSSTPPDPRVEDQKWFSNTFENGSGIKSTTSHFVNQGGFAYRYGGEKSPSQVRLEFSDPTITSSSLSPPSYSDGPASQSSEPSSSAHTFLTLPKIFNILLHSLSVSGSSTPELANTNSFTVSNILHLCQEYSAQLKPHNTSIDSTAAAQAVLNYPELRSPLVELAGVNANLFGEKEDDEPKPKVLTKEEAKFERQKELANKVGYWSATAQKRDQVFSSN